jgi:hypothetical protein
MSFLSGFAEKNEIPAHLLTYTLGFVLTLRVLTLQQAGGTSRLIIS